MAVDHVKSTPITNLDAVPRVENTTGEGAPGPLREVTGSAVAVASSSADATYRLVRVPSNAKIKSVMFRSAAQGAGKFDLGVYYPESVAHPDLAANAIDQDYFQTVVDCASAVLATECNVLPGLVKDNQPLWQGLGLASDPGGFFDIVATVKTTAVTTGTGRFGVSVRYVL